MVLMESHPDKLIGVSHAPRCFSPLPHPSFLFPLCLVQCQADPPSGLRGFISVSVFGPAPQVCSGDGSELQQTAVSTSSWLLFVSL